MQAQQVVSDWFLYLKNEKAYSAHTLRAYEGDLYAFFDFQSKHLGEGITLDVLKKISARDLRSWLASRHNEGMTAKSTARALSTLRSFYTYLDKQEILQNHAVFNVSTPKVKKSLPRPIAVEDAVKATQAIGDMSEESWVSNRDIALLTLIYGCGLRISEALGLNANELPITDVLRITGKGNKQREVPVLPVVKNAIENYLNSCPYPLDDSLFIGVRGGRLSPEVFRRNLQNLRRHLGLPESATPHAFRHSFATHLLGNGADLRDVQELLGHESVASTQVYTKVDARNLMAAYEAAHPKN